MIGDRFYALNKIADSPATYRLPLITVLAGAISALALPPTFQVWVLFLCFPYLLFAVSKAATLKKAFYIGWLFGFGHHVAGLYWISISLLVEPEKFGWLIPFAVSIIPSLAAIFIGLVTAGSWLIMKALSLYIAKNKSTTSPACHLPLIVYVITFAILWTASEYLRAHFILPFPWNFIGYSLNFSDSLMQISWLGSIYLTSFIIVLSASLPVLYFLLSTKSTPQRIAPAFIMPLIIINGFWIWGGTRLTAHPTNFRDDINLLLVQPDIKQNSKWDEAQRENNLERLVNLSLSVVKSGDGINTTAGVVIWPETAIPYIVSRDAEIPVPISRITGAGYQLISGIFRTDGEKYYNSAAIFSGGETTHITAFYDKHTLVPFGEYIPFRYLLPDSVKKISHGLADFSHGNGAKTIGSGIVPPFSPNICYEIIFPGEVADKTSAEKPQWLLTITNDSWFGNSSGPYQHFEMARVRAVEEGLPLIRVANNGISGIIDPLGRVISKTHLNESTVLTGKLPKPL